MKTLYRSPTCLRCGVPEQVIRKHRLPCPDTPDADGGHLAHKFAWTDRDEFLRRRPNAGARVRL